MTYHLMAQDVVAFMSREKLSRSIILGHSMGGKTAMVLADRFPHLVEKLVVVDIAPKVYLPRHLELVEAMENLDLNTCKTRQDLDAALSLSVTNPAIRQFLLKNVKRNAADHYFWQLNLSGIRANFDNLNVTTLPVKPVSIPTLFIRGGASDYILPEDERLIHSNFINAEMKTIPSSSHWVHADAPEQFVKMVKKFLSEQTEN